MTLSLAGVLPTGMGEAAERLTAEVLARWDESQRRYHDRRHLAEVLHRLEILGESSLPVVLAAWFHDAVYDPAATDNEELSAVLAERSLPSVGVSASEVAETARLVRLTAGHHAQDADDAGKALCDADLGILAEAPERYAQYAADVRAEHPHIDDTAFAAARADVLRDLLARPMLFRTAVARRLWEAPARANVTAELARLAGQR